MPLSTITKYKSVLEKNLKIIRLVFNDQNQFHLARARFFSALPFVVAGTLTAIVAAVYAKMFQIAEVQAVEIFKYMGYWSLLTSPAFFILSWLLVEKFAPNSNGSGIPQLMAAAEISNHNSLNPLLDKLLSIRIIFIKILSSLAGVLGGGVIGREGPTLQISGSIFHCIGRLINKEKHSQNHHFLVLAGGAAGLAAAFNTPLGGIAYAMEELSKSHLSAFRAGVLQSVIVAGLFAQLILGPYLYFGVPKVGPFQMEDSFLFFLCAVGSAVVVSLAGQIFKLIVIYRSQVESAKIKLVFAAACGFIVAAIALFINQSVLGSGKGILTDLLFNGQTSGFSQVMSRLAGTTVTYAAGGAGGIFAPTLSLGGTAASFIQGMFENHLGPLAVLTGMTAGLSALTQSPLTSFVLILEMTDRHVAIFPLMIAALIGQATSKLISKTSFYEFVCERILRPKTAQSV